MLNKLNKALTEQKTKQEKETQQVSERLQNRQKFEQEYRVNELTVIHPSFHAAVKAFKEKDYEAFFIRSKEEIAKEIGDFPDGNALSVAMYGETFYVFTHPDYNAQKVTIETKYGDICTKEHYSNREISPDLLDDIITTNYQKVVSDFG